MTEHTMERATIWSATDDDFERRKESIFYTRSFDTLLKVSQVIGHTHDAHKAINQILAILSGELNLQKGRVLLPDPDNGLLAIKYSYGLSQNEINQGAYAPGEGVTGQVLHSGRVAIVSDPHDAPDYLGRIVSPKQLAARAQAYFAVPIQIDDKILGVLAIYGDRPPKNQERNVGRLLLVVAAIIGQAIMLDRFVREQTRALASENEKLRNKLLNREKTYGILGESSLLKRALVQAKRAAQSSASVLLMGESGTGKERFARMIHFSSPRREKPFVCINCAAIPEQLLESELFGHEKGAFTGASQQRQGKFELANDGTLFLDEIGDMSLELQSKLLRALQERTIQRVGGSREVPINVRIITATHKNLKKAVNEERFRLDLYYRLNVIPIYLPPLRDREGDVRLLATYFLNRANQQNQANIVLDEQALIALEQYDWPGNIRQLENVIERLAIMSDSERVQRQTVELILEDERVVTIPQNHDVYKEEIREPAAASNRPYQWVSDIDRQRIEQALKQSGGNRTRAAALLGLTTRQLYYRLKKLMIE